jgi:hypothetical protein
MKRFIWNLAFLLCAVNMASCVTRTLMLDAPLVSMTKGPKPKGGYKVGNDVKANYCSGDKAISTDESVVGMIDEVVYRAQKSSKASYIAEVTIYEVNKLFSNPCYELKGKAAN